MPRVLIEGLFDPTPDFSSPVALLAAAAISTLLLLTGLLPLFAKRIPRIPKATEKLGGLASFGILGLLFAFFRWQGIPWLGSNLAAFAIAIALALWAILAVRSLPLRKPEASQEERLLLRRWRPRPRHER